MTIRSRLILAFSTIVVVLVAVGAAYQASLSQLSSAKSWVEHTVVVLQRLELVNSYFKDLEYGQRGYCLTHRDMFLEPFNAAVTKIPALTLELQNLTSDNPSEVRRLAHLEDVETEKLARAQRSIDTARSDPKTAFDPIMAGSSDKLMGEIHQLVRDAQDEERELLAKRTAEAEKLLNLITVGTTFGVCLAILLVGISGFRIINLFSRSFGNLQEGLNKIGQGDLNHTIQAVDTNDEFGKLADSFNQMTTKLQQSKQEIDNHLWLNSGLARFGQMLQGEKNLQNAAQKVLTELASELGSRHGMFYILAPQHDVAELVLLASYAHQERKSLANTFALGQGVIGQCAFEKQRIVVSNLPDDYARISSGTGEATPTCVAVVPVMFEGNVKAVIEQSSFTPFTQVQLRYLDQAAQNLGVILTSIDSSHHTEQLLAQEQQMTEELQSQQEELTETNRKLEATSQTLQASEEELRQQQEELQQTNEELEERTRIQSKQNLELEAKNIELEQMRISMQEKAEQLSLSSKYKSEFLSNMSHELRTPLNSLLILSKVLMSNAEGNLTDSQVEYARTINSAGSDLLTLIDDVLDISKIEAGAMSIDVAEEPLRELSQSILLNFDAIAKNKGIALSVDTNPNLPRFIKTDGRRLMQILKNIVANAVKFTEAGSVLIKVDPADGGWSRDVKSLQDANAVIAFSVTDTGIGIPQDKQRVIFEAFQQADGTTHRKFGGTGLGLAISREIARLLGGEIKLASEEGKGSTFTVFLPAEYSGPAGDNGNNGAAAAKIAAAARKQLAVETPRPSIPSDSAVPDDRSEIVSGDKVLLMMQQDANVSRQVIDLAHARGFRVLCATQGKTAFALAQRYKPDAIMLDVGLPNKDGWIFLDRLKRDFATRHIPVHVISDEEHAQQARRLGAIGYSTKPASPQMLSEMLNHLKSFVSRDERRLLIVEDNITERQNLEQLIDGTDVQTTSVASGKAALEALALKTYDCMILDLGLPDMTGFDLLHKIQSDPALQEMRIIIHTNRSLTSQEETELRRTSEAIVVKGAKSAERLLDETTLFLHRIESNLPEQKRKMLERLHLKDPLLSGRKILIVDDDIRQIFAVTSLLEQYNMQVKYAENGQQALDMLSTTPGIELILMDVMMPDMDGFEAMRRIRDMEQYRNLPIIALTAKAMKGDRDQCHAAGASDYLSKPVDNDQLLSLMRVWLY
ncbi:MAG TPA: response regulator [Planktothrix sp.]|jgi:hypothetical protein